MRTLWRSGTVENENLLAGAIGFRSAFTGPNKLERPPFFVKPSRVSSRVSLHHHPNDDPHMLDQMVAASLTLLGIWWKVMRSRSLFTEGGTKIDPMEATLDFSFILKWTWFILVYPVLWWTHIKKDNLSTKKTKHEEGFSHCISPNCLIHNLGVLSQWHIFHWMGWRENLQKPQSIIGGTRHPKKHVKKNGSSRFCVQPFHELPWAVLWDCFGATCWG